MALPDSANKRLTAHQQHLSNYAHLVATLSMRFDLPPPTEQHATPLALVRNFYSLPEKELWHNRVSGAMKQATCDNLKRWYVFTDKGRKVAWCETELDARAKAEANGLKVSRIKPAPPLR